MAEPVPLLSLRGISDGSQSPIAFNHEELLDEDCNLRKGVVVKSMFRHPLLIGRFLKMGQNTAKAAENAAIALIAALGRPDAVVFRGIGV